MKQEDLEFYNWLIKVEGVSPSEAKLMVAERIVSSAASFEQVMTSLLDLNIKD